MSELSIENPRPIIREYLAKLFEMLAEDFPSSWPHISRQEYFHLYKTFQQRAAQLYIFVDKHPTLKKDQKLSARFFIESALRLLELDWSRPDSHNEPSPEVLKQLEGRPVAVQHFDQLYCTPDSTQRRIERLLQEQDITNSDVLFLGDDDLGSVVLAPHFEQAQGHGQVHMLDLDDRLLEFVAQRSPSVIRHKIDLQYGGIPKELHNYFNAIFLDPPWSYDGSWFFFNKAIYCLSQSDNARIYLSFCPIQLELEKNNMARFWKRLSGLGLTCESIEPAFNLYSLDAKDTPAFREELDTYLPDVGSPLLEFLRQVPFGFSNLYSIRRIKHHRGSVMQRWFFNWWNSA